MVQVTPKAAEMLRHTLRQHGAEGRPIRLLVREKGCNCSKYRMAIDEAVREDDLVVEVEGLRLVIDPKSAPALEGVVVDFAEGPQGAGFVIQAPPEQGDAGCGCGHN